ncbi:MAG TPA: hypothetical protein VJM34_03505 [Novosphingobium sp.]|nr:hypothetical protein [Novosphingobium sp.]
MDRAAKQAERRRVAHQQALHRQALLDASAQAAAEYEAIVDALTGAHRIALSRRDWLTTATAPPVPIPDRRDDAERRAAAELENYSPGWFTRVLKREERARQALADAIDAARAQDDSEHARAVQAAEAENLGIAQAQRVVERDPEAMVRALEDHSALGDLPFSVEGLDTLFVDGRVIAVVDGLDLEDMPEESISLLKSGKASVKALPVGKRYELHRDAICSAAVRVAIEFLAALPIEEIEVVMLTDILDRGSGHINARPVLHLRVALQALGALNLQRAEAAALVDRLGGHMDWTKRDGFRAINAAAFGVDLDD